VAVAAPVVAVIVPVAPAPVVSMLVAVRRATFAATLIRVGARVLGVPFLPPVAP